MRYSPCQVTPNVVYRYFAFDAGNGYPGHKHTIDHYTILTSGAVQVEVEGEETKVYEAPAHFLQPKDKVHTITAIDNGTTWLCLFVCPPELDADRDHFWNAQ